MIQEIQLSNFKAFADTVTIPIKPITLIFGPNSSGKSSFFQSLLMLKQTIEESVSDKQTLLPKGSLVDLGNYREFIHNHDESRSFSVTFKIAPPIDLYDTIPAEEYLTQKAGSDRLNNLESSIESLPLGITIEFSSNNNKETHVTKVALLVGDDPTPIITFVNEPPESMESLGGDADEKVKSKRERQWRNYRRSPKNYLKFKKIENHDYWKSYFKYIKEDEYWKNFKEEFESLSEGKDISAQRLETLTPEQQELLSKLDISLSDIFNPIINLFAEDFLILSKFLPVELNGYDPQYLTSSDFDNEEQDNISVLILAVSFIIKRFLSSCVHLGPVRQNPERNFFFSGIISPYVGVNGQYTNEILVNNPELVKEVNKQLARLNLGYRIQISILSDESTDLKVSTIRLISDSGIDHAITDVGYGISQVLPVILQCMLSKGETILIEQPELHLHPAQQAELGSFFASCIRSEESAASNIQKENDTNNFIIETHSENLILRIQKLIRKGKLKKEDVAVIYFDKTSDGTVATELRLNDKGEFIDPWPQGFFEESFKEMFED